MARTDDTTPTSRIPGFYNFSVEQRISLVARWAGLSDEEQAILLHGGLGLAQADHMIENVIATFGLPLGIATNFTINGRDYLVPMAIEEPSVVAGASYAAKLARGGGGFAAHTTSPEMIAQIQVLDVIDPWSARFAVLDQREQLLAQADAVDPVIVRLGGGMRGLEVDVIDHPAVGAMLEVRLIYDCRDAMGANALNTIAETLAPAVAEIAGGRTNLRIISNLADRRLARARCMIPAQALGPDASSGIKGYSGAVVVQRIVEAYALAASSPYRAATHNKGIMNGIDAVVVATGNDWRAVEAGAHAYAARTGRYSSLSHWEANAQGDLVGTLELPMAVGTVGGATRVHPMSKIALKILKVESAMELAGVIASVGLAQNLAALRALASEGIQSGHMKLHARQVAVAAGAIGAQIEQVAQRLIEDNTIRIDRAQEIVRGLE